MSSGRFQIHLFAAGEIVPPFAVLDFAFQVHDTVDAFGGLERNRRDEAPSITCPHNPTHDSVPDSSAPHLAVTLPSC